MTICKMTIEENGEKLQGFELGVGEHWNLIADDFEKENPEKKVINIEGLKSINATVLDLNESDKREIIEQALHNFAKKEWDWYKATTSSDMDALKKCKIALSLLVELGA